MMYLISSALKTYLLSTLCFSTGKLEGVWVRNCEYIHSCTTDISKALSQLHILPEDGMCGVSKHVGELTTCEEDI